MLGRDGVKGDIMVEDEKEESLGVEDDASGT